MRFRKKPVEVDAILYTGKNGPEIRDWSREHREERFVTKKNSSAQTWNFIKSEDWGSEITAAVYDYLHDTWVGVKNGQWIIRGTKGEYYPCDAEGDAPMNYEPAVDDPHVARRFYLQRKNDVTGVHDDGVIAYGVLFGNGTAVLNWRPGHGVKESSVAVWHGGLDDVRATHLHDRSSTELVWID